MLKTYVLAPCLYLFAVCAIAQDHSVSSVLQEIETNNAELKAYLSLIEHDILDLKSGNNLPDPELGGYYMPFGHHVGTVYTEFEFTQSIEFPTVYSARKKLIETQVKQLELGLQQKRVEILMPAKQHCFEVILLNKKLAIEQSRVDQAIKVYDQVEIRFKSGQVGVLAFNKAKIAWMQKQFSVQQVEVEKQNLLLLLTNLNGGIAISLEQNSLSDSFEIATLDSLWNEKSLKDPVLQMMKQQQDIALQRLQLTKKKTLPNLTAGFNRQGISGDYYSGVYGGLSIPLWSNKHRVKSEEAHYTYQQSSNEVEVLQAFTRFETQYNQYQLQRQRLQEYQKTMNGLNSEALLLKAYELGEISFMEYYMELSFYRDAMDAELQLELELILLKTELLKHQS